MPWCPARARACISLSLALCRACCGDATLSRPGDSSWPKRLSRIFPPSSSHPSFPEATAVCATEEDGRVCVRRENFFSSFFVCLVGDMSPSSLRPKALSRGKGRREAELHLSPGPVSWGFISMLLAASLGGTLQRHEQICPNASIQPYDHAFSSGKLKRV